MTKFSKAKIVSVSSEGELICAASARLSTSEGNAAEILLRSGDSTRNNNLIRKVLSSGHRSVIEHAVFTIAFTNVSVYVEQFFIESRLASFTVKSRRYVDFSSSGYYIPSQLSKGANLAYTMFMDSAISGYKELLDLGIPKEDARFLLPYSFFSNFYCTMNARELIKVINAIRCGRGQHSAELQDLAEQLIQQLCELLPCIAEEFSDRETKKFAPAQCCNTTEFSYKAIGEVNLVNYTQNPESILQLALTSAGMPDLSLVELVRDQRPRALEHLNYSFILKDITLAGITHLVRHRMQSVIVPPLEQALMSRRIVRPKSINDNAEAGEIYTQTIYMCDALYVRAMQFSELTQYAMYFALSGNLLDVMVTMNARELLLFSSLRTCTRAQWEIRAIAENMLKKLRENFSELFKYYGPSCYILGKCPEGKMCCGRQQEMQNKFGVPLSKTSYFQEDKTIST